MDFKEILVHKVPWAENNRSMALLTKRGRSEVESWSELKWFPKSICELNRETGVLKIPVWLYKKMFEK